MAGEDQVRASFAEQALWCERLGSPFTARLCSVLGRRIDRATAIGRRLLGWPGDPRGAADALALRLCGGLHALVRSGDAPRLARLYPLAPPPDEDILWPAIGQVLRRHETALHRWLDGAPQTNEVGRAAPLMAGLMVVADRFRLPVRLHELGASAGLNLLLDRYGYDLGGRSAGDPGSPLQIAPEWKGPAPPDAKVRILGRAGVDLNPARLPADRERLLAYVWPDQPRRLARIGTALDLAAADPPCLDRADAADWIEARLAAAPEPGVARVVLHSVAFQYFGAGAQARIARHIEAAGARAGAGAPLAWLRFEKRPEDEKYSLRLRTWPGDDRLLAWAHPHGSSVRWFG